MGVRTTYFGADTYPAELKNIYDPPAILYYRGGEFKDLNEVAVACVGTRRPTRISYNAVNFLVPQLISDGCVIVSGLALGVDKLSHQACITAGGKTIAVLAHGLDMLYPKSNIPLANRILDTGGILVSEYPVKSSPTRYSFVNRNRLIVGLSKAVIIYECDINGGTMHNAKYAELQGKPVFCPEVGIPTTEIQKGTRYLLDDNKARLIKNGRDLQGIRTELKLIEGIQQLPTDRIWENYLLSLLQVMESPEVLMSACRKNNVTIELSGILYRDMQLILGELKRKGLFVKEFINDLVEENINESKHNKDMSE